MSVVRTVNLAKKEQKVKVEVESEDEISIECRLCSKSFCNERAVRNHLRMEHSGQEVDVDEWVRAAKPVPKPPKVSAAIKKQVIAANTEKLISSMKPVDISTLASRDVSYIIIKEEPTENDNGTNSEISQTTQKEVKKRKADSFQEGLRKIHMKKEREIVPITGPFECLQPSSLISESTCHQIFFSCCDYSIHFRDEHTRRRKAIKCQVCEKVLASSIGEETTSKYPCHVCNAGFETNEDLSDHLNTNHLKLKPYQCGVCNKRFTQQGGVQQHMRVHTGVRPFPCTICSKAFTQKSGLEQHLRTHTKTKPYRCVVCGKSFIQSIHLKQHMRIHTNIAPYQCIICEKKFKQSSHLNYHLKNHTEANMTELQREKYEALVGMIDADEANANAETSENNEGNEWTEENMIEGESEENLIEGESEGILVEAGEEYLIGDNEVIVEEVDEGNIILDENGEYVISDSDGKTWNVKIVH